MHIIADLQLHSRFSRAVSKQMTIPFIASWAKRKGIGLVATGDWTHPMWFREIQQHLEEMGNGLLRLKSSAAGDEIILDPLLARTSSYKDFVSNQGSNSSDLSRADLGKRSAKILSPSAAPLFLLATEVSCIYTQNGKGRRVHTLIWVPTLASAAKINQEMTKRGCNLLSDGRPIIGLTSIQVAELVFAIEPNALIIPAHVWTPWFSVYGSMSGFDSISEAFGEYANRIYAVETGLSSNPAMNWRIKELDNRSIVSFSDAHSGPKLGREATVFEIPELSYDAIYSAIKNGGNAPGDKNLLDPLIREALPAGRQGSAKILSPVASSLPISKSSALSSRIAYTIEFYPEEGKYHWSGHRACNIRWSPQQSSENGTTCPVCGKRLTQGVEQRVSELASRSMDDLALSKSKAGEVSGKMFPQRPPFIMLVPLQEIIAEAIGSPVQSVKVQTLYTQLTDRVGTEFAILLTADFDSIAHVGGNKLAEAIGRVRQGQVHIDPGYDGVFGVVKIWDVGKRGVAESGKEQLSLLT